MVVMDEEWVVGAEVGLTVSLLVVVAVVALVVVVASLRFNSSLTTTKQRAAVRHKATMLTNTKTPFKTPLDF